MLKWSQCFGAALIVALSAGHIQAQEFPSQPIRIIVPSAAGGGTDVVARLVQQAAEASVGVPMPIINMPGGGTALGSREVATSDADGHSVLMIHEAMLSASAQGIFDLGHQSLRPVAMTGRDFSLIVVSADSNYETLEDLYEGARSGRVTAGVNIGGLNHLTSIIAAEAGGVEFAPVQYSGGAESVKALLGGHIDVIFTVPLEVIPYVESGDFRVLASMSDKRSSAFPDVPSTKELGFDAYSETSHMWWVPAATPDDRVEILADIFENAMSNENLLDQFSSRYIETIYLRDEALDEFVTNKSELIETLIERFDLRSN